MRWFRTDDDGVTEIRDPSQGIEKRVAALELEALNRRETEDENILKVGNRFIVHVRRKAASGTGVNCWTPPVEEHYTVRTTRELTPSWSIEASDMAMLSRLVMHHNTRGKRCHY